MKPCRECTRNISEAGDFFVLNVERRIQRGTNGTDEDSSTSPKRSSSLAVPAYIVQVHRESAASAREAIHCYRTVRVRGDYDFSIWNWCVQS